MAPRFDDDAEEYWDHDFSSDEDEADDEGESEGGDDLEALLARAEELSESGENRAALRLWRRSIDRFADEAEAHFQYALTAFRELEELSGGSEISWGAEPELVGLYEEALSELEEAVAIDDSHHPAWNLMGALYALRGNHESAVTCWEKSLEILPNQPKVREDLEASRDQLG
jgi:tetratricopeptide (TPR) repeat protein